MCGNQIVYVAFSHFQLAINELLLGYLWMCTPAIFAHIREFLWRLINYQTEATECHAACLPQA